MDPRVLDHILRRELLVSLLSTSIGSRESAALCVALPERTLQ